MGLIKWLILSDLMSRFIIKNNLLIGLFVILSLYMHGCQKTLYGCTYVDACNYDPEATIDDASCDYEICVGCTNSWACNYNPEATVDNNSCEFALDNLEPWELAWWDCDGNFVDHRTQYVGEWEFHVETYNSYNSGDPEYESYQFYIDSIKYADMQGPGGLANKIEVPFNWGGDTWTFTVNEFGQLQSEEWGMIDSGNNALFSYFSVVNNFNNFLEMDISNYYESPTITNDSLLYMNISQSFYSWIPGTNNYSIYHLYAKKVN